MKNKNIIFYHHGDMFKIDSQTGDVMSCNGHSFAKRDRRAHQWQIPGVSFHHWRRGIDLKIQDVTDPKQLKGGIVWDVDHGTVRIWGGQYCGKLPRITDAWFEEK